MADHSFFDRFFDDAPAPEVNICIDCGTTANLTMWGSATGGNQMYICDTCRRKREAKYREEETSARASVEWSESFNEWEEAA